MFEYPVGCALRTIELRYLTGLVLCLLLALPTTPSHANTRLTVKTATTQPLQIFVSVSTHHADLHNGYSRVRYQALLTSNTRHKIPLDFYLTRVHDSAWAYHPDYLFAGVQSEGRTDPLPDIQLNSWEKLLDEMETLPLTGTGPTLHRMNEHLRLYHKYYLPALDDAGRPPAPDALARLQALYRRATDMSGTGQELPPGSAEQTALRLHKQAGDSLERTRKLLALQREQRIAMREFDALIAGPKPMKAALQREPGLNQVADYLTTLPARGNKPSEGPTWQGHHVDVKFSYQLGDHYRFRSDDYPEPLSCYRGSVLFDGTHLTGGAFPELQASVPADFCLYPDGEWRLRS